MDLSQVEMGAPLGRCIVISLHYSCMYVMTSFKYHT